MKAKLAALSQNFPEGVDYTIAYDSTDVVSASIREVIITLFITLLLVVFTVYVFLQNFRATIIPAVTIPVSLIGTFAVLLVATIVSLVAVPMIYAIIQGFSDRRAKKAD